MLDRSWRRRIALATAAGGVALALAAAPVAPDGELPGFALKAALAKAGGDKGGNGADKANKGGKKGGAGGAGATILVNPEDDSHGKGHTGKGDGHRKDKNAVSGVLSSHNGPHPENHGALSSLLGSLNAAHAIANGNTNENLNSRVGQIRAYMEAFNDYVAGEEGVTVEDVANALIDASNKDLTSMEIDDIKSVVSGVNDLIGDNEQPSLTTAEQASLTAAEDDVVVEIDLRE
jgi:hypothetical protein